MNIKMSNLNIYLLLCMLASCTFNARSIHSTHHEIHHDEVANMSALQKEAFLVKLINEFLDTKNHPHKKFSSYAHDLITLLESDKTRTDLKEFCNTLKKIKNMTNTRLIGLNLLKYKDLLPKSAKDAIQSKKNELQTILEKRVN